MAIGTLSIDLRAQLASLEADLGRAGRLVEKQTADMAARWDAVAGAATALVGAVSVGAVTAWARSLIDGVDALNDAADATGSTVEAMSALEDVAKRNGHTLDGYTEIIAKLNNALRQADGTNAQAQAFKALGLNLAELRQADPAEMALTVAHALERFADGGSKARLQQVLLGESAGKAAPLLKDLAEQGRLVAKVTSEQALEAERFNKALAAMQADASSAGRSLLMNFLPSLNEVIERARIGNTVFGGFFATQAGREMFAGDADATAAMLRARQELLENETKIAKIREYQTSGRATQFDLIALNAAEGQTETLRKRVEYYSKILRLSDQAGAGRGVVNPGVVKPVLPEISGGSGGPAKPPPFVLVGPEIDPALLKAREEQVRAIQQAIAATPMAQMESLRALIASLDQYGREGGNPDQIAQAMAAAQEKLAAFSSAGMGPDIDPQLLAARTREAQMAEQALASTAAGRVADLNAMRQAVAQALQEGTADPAQAGQAIQMIDDEIKRLTTSAEDLGEMMRASLGDGLRMALQGNFQGIAQMFQNLVLEKIARDAEKMLTGLWDSAGGLGGVLGGVGGLLGSLFGAVPKFAAGGDHSGGWRLVGERGPELQATGPARIFSAAQTRQILAGGGNAGQGGGAAPIIQLGGNTYHVGAGVSIAQVQAVVQASERRQASQLNRMRTEGRLG